MGVVLVTVCVIALAVVIADDFTGVGAVDDVLLGPLGTGVGKGLIMVLDKFLTGDSYVAGN